MIVFDEHKNRVALGESVGRGGEAAVYRVLNQPGRLVKIYEPAPRPNYAAKLAWMAGHPPANPTRDLEHASLAWPDGLFYDARRNLIGYGMPYIQHAVSLLDVFNPRRRAQVLPGFDRRYLHRTARNLAAALSALHNSGYVAGDLNESNVLVTRSALVTLIDTDSFQVREDRGGKIILHPCPVGKPEYTPPELQGKSLAEVHRQPDHDAFGLAVLIFQLLMDGSHPFRAQWLAAGDPPPLEQRIARGAFPYIANPNFPVAPPKRAPGLDTLHPWLAELFRRCFVEGHRDPRYRPGPDLWLRAIAEAEKSLVCCAQGHFYAGHQERCPYCALAPHPQPRPQQRQPERAQQRTAERPHGGRQSGGGRQQPRRPAPAPRQSQGRQSGWNPAPFSQPGQSGTAAAARPGYPPLGTLLARWAAGQVSRRPAQQPHGWGTFQSPAAGVNLRHQLGLHPAVVRRWIKERSIKSVTIGGPYGALAGALPGALIALYCWSAALPMDWPLLFAAGGAAGGLLRGWKPGYRLGGLVNRFIGWDRFWQAVGLMAGAVGGLLLGLVFVWAIIPVFLGLILGARTGRYLGGKLYQGGSLVGWERIWGLLSAVSTAALGWTVARGALSIGAAALGEPLVEYLLPYTANGSLLWALAWTLAGGLGGGLAGTFSGILADLFGRLSGLVD